MIESAVGIIGACLPLMRPLISGTSSRGFMRNLNSFNGTASDSSGTFWDHSDNSKLRNEWNSSIASTKFSQASTKNGCSVGTTKLEFVTQPEFMTQPTKPKASMSAMKWENDSLPDIDSSYH